MPNSSRRSASSANRYSVLVWVCAKVEDKKPPQRPEAPSPIKVCSIRIISASGLRSYVCIAAQRPVKPPPTMSNSHLSSEVIGASGSGMMSGSYQSGRTAASFSACRYIFISSTRSSFNAGKRKALDLFYKSRASEERMSRSILHRFQLAILV